MDTDDDWSRFVDHSQLGEDAPLEVEEPVSFSESDARQRINGTGAGHHEVESTETANEIQVDLFGEDLGTVERSRETRLGLGHASRREEMESHRHRDRLKQRSTGTYEAPFHVRKAVVRRHEYRAVARVAGQLPETREQLLASGKVRYERCQVVDKARVGARQGKEPFPDGFANSCPFNSLLGFLVLGSFHDSLLQANPHCTDVVSGRKSAHATTFLDLRNLLASLKYGRVDAKSFGIRSQTRPLGLGNGRQRTTSLGVTTMSTVTSWAA